jgi:hypothetical protein
MSELIVVTATKDGFLGSYRKVGDTFEVTPEQFSDFWMVEGTRVSPRQTHDLKTAARSEAISAGGVTAALEAALSDLRDERAAKEKLQERIQELEEQIALAKPATEETTEPDEADATVAGPGAGAPMQRVRRTLQA